MLITRDLERDTVLSLFHLLYDDRGATPLLEQLVAAHLRMQSSGRRGVCTPVTAMARRH